MSEHWASEPFAPSEAAHATVAGLTVSEIQCLAQSALAASSVHALRELIVEENDEGLLISGQVTSFYHKQLAQELVRAIAGRTSLVNSVRVH